MPGTHGPGGPVQNIAGLRVETPDGQPIAWRRDETEPYRIECTVPDGVDRVVVRLDYICNQPTINSEGVDNFGNAYLGLINWNTCLLYPEGPTIDELHISARLLLPAKWRFGTALKVAKETEGAVEFNSETLLDFIDCPLICGEHFRAIELKAKNFPPTFLHLTSESPGALQLDEKVVEKYGNVASEAGALFGGAHFPAFQFLVTRSDELGYNGLEHLSSSLNGVRERDLIDDKKRRRWVAMLLPHEFVHSWCGKYRRPAAMVTPNFHTPERTALLWVYEGLTQYLGEVLQVRSGLTTTNDYMAELAGRISSLMHTEGRQWRPLEDTAIANHVLRAFSPSWGQLRRSQDYYDEGMLLWLEADAIIRQQSDGHHCLDDFCKKFMGPERTEKIQQPAHERRHRRQRDQTANRVPRPRRRHLPRLHSAIRGWAEISRTCPRHEQTRHPDGDPQAGRPSGEVGQTIKTCPSPRKNCSPRRWQGTSAVQTQNRSDAC